MTRTIGGSIGIEHLEKVADVVDQLIDVMINYRQSGHPGGSRSKVQTVVSLLLGGIMRWDIRMPEKALGDRLILGAGHTVPVIYATLAVLCEAMDVKYKATRESRYYIEPRKSLQIRDLISFRRRGGLSGHAEVTDKTLILKYNTGPTAHGVAAAVGQAFALKRAGCGETSVFVLDGEGAHTAGAFHEAKNSAWGLGLDNLYVILDWNDFGIDDRAYSSIVYGDPQTWFESCGWHTVGTPNGSSLSAVIDTLSHMRYGSKPKGIPSCAWVKTRKGRGYLVYDSHSHGVPHATNSEMFWKTKEPFMSRHNVSLAGYQEPVPLNMEQLQEQFATNLSIIADVIRKDDQLVNAITDQLDFLAQQVPEKGVYHVSFRGNPLRDPALFDYPSYPDSMFFPAGAIASTRDGMARWGRWVNSWCHKKYGRPLFLGLSADLAASTRVAAFGEPCGEFGGYGWYDRDVNANGVVLPQGITEFVNAGIVTGFASTNLSEEPRVEFDGFLGACSTYGAFAYLKYGMMRLFSQLAQDSPLKVGKVLWILGHSGPETADDSRTHFGVFTPGVAQLFPKGKILNLFPWEPNEVPVVLGEALRHDIPIIALHLTRPNMVVPNRISSGMPSHLAAAKGAYILKGFAPGKAKMGTIIVQGSSTVAGICEILPVLDQLGINVKVVVAVSHELFVCEPKECRELVLSTDDYRNSMVVTNMAKVVAQPWITNDTASRYTLSADWDNNWRTGGLVTEVLDEAHLSPQWILRAIRDFVARLEN